MPGGKPALISRGCRRWMLAMLAVMVPGSVWAQGGLPLPGEWRRVANSMQLLGDFNGDGVIDTVRVLRQDGQGDAMIWVSLGGLHGAMRHFPVAGLGADQAAAARFTYTDRENGSRAVGILVTRPDGKRFSIRWQEDRFMVDNDPG